METNALRTKQEEYKAQLTIVREQIINLIEYAVNYDELIDSYEEVEEIDQSEIIWNDGIDERKYDALCKEEWLYNRLIKLVDEIIEAQGDKKKEHNLRKSYEELISTFRKEKNTSAEIIAFEEEHIKKNSEAIKFVDELRN